MDSDVNVWASKQVFQCAVTAHNGSELSFLFLSKRRMVWLLLSDFLCGCILQVCDQALRNQFWTVSNFISCIIVCDLQKLGSSMQCEEGTEWLLELLMEVQLQQYFLRIRDDLNVTRLSHFDYVKNEDLEKIGMGRPGEKLCVCVCVCVCVRACVWI